MYIHVIGYYFLLTSSILWGISVRTANDLDSVIVKGSATIQFAQDVHFSHFFLPIGTNPSFNNRKQDISIDGNGYSLIANGAYRGFAIGGNPEKGGTGTISLQNLTFKHCQAKGGDAECGGGGGAGMGGALLINDGATVVGHDLHFVECSAIGGNSIKGEERAYGGGGGGGLCGNGGRSAQFASGGGGGGGFAGKGEASKRTSPKGGRGGPVRNQIIQDNLPSSLQNGRTSHHIGGNGGNGKKSANNGQHGSDFGGGGGGGHIAKNTSGFGGRGGFGGGGGGGQGLNKGTSGSGGDGGFGGGGGSSGGIDRSSIAGVAGVGGFAAGDGSIGAGLQTPAGGGGAALGGAIFIRNGGKFTLDISEHYQGDLFTHSSIQGGNGSHHGKAHGRDIFLMSGGTLTFNLESDLVLEHAIEGDQGAGGGSGGSLNKIGKAMLTLPANNTFDGTLNICEGTVAISDHTCLGNDKAQLMINGGKLRVISSFALSRNIDIGDDGGTISVDSDQLFTAHGLIQGKGILTKEGTGTLSLASQQGFPGPLIVKEGKLSIGKGGNLGTGNSSVTLHNGTLYSAATFVTDRSFLLQGNENVISTEKDSMLELRGKVSGNANLVKNGPGTLKLTEANIFTGSINIHEGTISVNHPQNLGEGRALISMTGGRLHTSSDLLTARDIALSSAGGEIQINDQCTFTSTGIISGTGPLHKTGSGRLILTPNNQLQSTIHLHQGTTTVTDDSSFGDTSTDIILDGGHLQASSSFTTMRKFTLADGGGKISVDKGHILTVRGEIGGSGTLTIEGLGEVYWEGTSNFSGKTTLKEGNRKIASASAIPGKGMIELDHHTFVITDDFTLERTCYFCEGESQFNINPGKALTLANTLEGPGNFAKFGKGMLIISGNSPDFKTQIDDYQGTLIVQGDLGSSVMVHSGGILKGNGTIGHIVNDGVIIPGSSIGTLHISGNFSQSPNGKLTIEFSPTDSDKLIITGTASLDGELSLEPEEGSYAAGTTYTIIEASSITGRFSTITGDLPFAAYVTYNTDTVVLTIGRKIDLSTLTGNPKSLADFLLCSSNPTINDDLNNIISQLNTLDSQDLIDALNHLSPSQMGALPLINARTATTLFYTNFPKLTSFPENRRWLYAIPLFNYFSQKPLDAQYGFDANNGGVLIGTTYASQHHLQAGFFAGYTYTKLHWDHQAGKSKLSSGYLAPYLGFRSKQFGLDVEPNGNSQSL